MGGRVQRFTVAVRAKPGSRVPRVGGAWGDPAELVVAVAERADQGAANAAVVAAVAKAFGVPGSAVVILHGHRGRSKLLAIDAEPAPLAAVLERLLAG